MAICSVWLSVQYGYLFSSLAICSVWLSVQYGYLFSATGFNYITVNNLVCAYYELLTRLTMCIYVLDYLPS